MTKPSSSPARQRPVPYRQFLARIRRRITSGPGQAKATAPLRPLLRLDDHILRDIGLPGHEAPVRRPGPQHW